MGRGRLRAGGGTDPSLRRLLLSQSGVQAAAEQAKNTRQTHSGDAWWGVFIFWPDRAYPRRNPDSIVQGLATYVKGTAGMLAF